jgi:hypothetical protein
MTIVRYDRAFKAHLILQHVDERWADEVFANANSENCRDR